MLEQLSSKLISKIVYHYIAQLFTQMETANVVFQLKLF